MNIRTESIFFGIYRGGTAPGNNNLPLGNYDKINLHQIFKVINTLNCLLKLLAEGGEFIMFQGDFFVGDEAKSSSPPCARHPRLSNASSNVNATLINVFKTVAARNRCRCRRKNTIRIFIHLDQRLKQ